MTNPNYNRVVMSLCVYGCISFASFASLQAEQEEKAGRVFYPITNQSEMIAFAPRFDEELIAGDQITSTDIPLTMTNEQCDVFTYLAQCTNETVSKFVDDYPSPFTQDDTHDDSDIIEGGDVATLGLTQDQQNSFCGQDVNQCFQPAATSCQTECYNPCTYTAALAGGGSGGFGSGGGGSAGAYSAGGGGGGAAAGAGASASANASQNQSQEQSQSQNQHQSQHQEQEQTVPLPEPSTWLLFSSMVGMAIYMKYRRESQVKKQVEETNDK